MFRDTKIVTPSFSVIRVNWACFGWLLIILIHFSLSSGEDAIAKDGTLTAHEHFPETGDGSYAESYNTSQNYIE